MTASLSGPLIGEELKGKVGLSIMYTKTTAIFHQLHTGQKSSDVGMLCVGVNADYSLSLLIQRTMLEHMCKTCPVKMGQHTMTN